MSSQNEFTSWKEIAEHLGVNVRTAQKWEQDLGLPVRRMPGAKGRVSADRAEIVAWQQRTKVKPGRWESVRFLQRYAVAATVAAVAAGGWGLAERIERWWPRTPLSFRVERTALVAQDAQGRERWRYAFGSPVTDYQGALASGIRLVWSDDLDGDGKSEVLFVHRSPDHLQDSLHCLDEKGKPRWRYVPGREVRTGKGLFKPPFSIRDLAVVSGRNGERWVAVSSSHPIYYPGGIFLLDAQGRVVGEYWHDGVFSRINAADLDNDGDGEIYASGTNSAEKTGTLVVLDPRQMRGPTAARESDPNYQIQGYPLARERARILFPRSRLNRTLQAYSEARRVWLSPHSILVDVLEQWDTYPRAATIYEFSPELKLERFELTDGFRAYHAEMTAAKVLNYPLEEEERMPERLRIIRNPPAAEQRAAPGA